MLHLAELVAEGVDAVRERPEVVEQDLALRVQPIRIRWRRQHLNPVRRQSSSISTIPSAIMPSPARRVCGEPSRYLTPDGIQSREAIDLDRMIAESIQMHPHGADHFEELFPAIRCR